MLISIVIIVAMNCMIIIVLITTIAIIIINIVNRIILIITFIAIINDDHSIIVNATLIVSMHDHHHDNHNNHLHYEHLYAATHPRRPTQRDPPATHPRPTGCWECFGGKGVLAIVEQLLIHHKKGIRNNVFSWLGVIAIYQSRNPRRSRYYTWSLCQKNLCDDGSSHAAPWRVDLGKRFIWLFEIVLWICAITQSNKHIGFELNRSIRIFLFQKKPKHRRRACRRWIIWFPNNILRYFRKKRPRKRRFRRCRWRCRWRCLFLQTCQILCRTCRTWRWHDPLLNHDWTLADGISRR